MPLSGGTVAIAGLGLMGGSLALALRDSGATLVGVTRRPEAAAAALAAGVVDRAGCDLAAAAAQADILVLALPVRAILAAIPEAGAHLQPGALLLDLGSTKRAVVAAMNELPPGVGAVGGHPMCGKETGGLASATATLYQGAPFVLTPTSRTTPEALALATELAEAAGARPHVLDAARHDAAVAVISHLPYVLAAALVRTEGAAAAQDPVVDALVAGGFRDTTRVAASPVEMMRDILLTNRDAVLAALDTCTGHLDRLRGMLDDPAALQAWIAEAQAGRRRVFPG